MEQVGNLNPIYQSKVLLSEFFGELRQLTPSASRVHVKVIDDYLPKLISCRNHVEQVLVGKIGSIRLNTVQNIEPVLNSLNEIVTILLRMPVSQSDEEFLKQYFKSIQLILENSKVLINESKQLS